MQESGAVLQFQILNSSPHAAVRPHVVTLSHLNVTENRWASVTSEVLKAEVPDLADSEVEFVLSSEPLKGELQVLDSESQEWFSLLSGDAFMQSDIDDGLVRFVTNETSLKKTSLTN